MKKQILISLISISSILTMNAQIYTPSSSIQGPSGNNYVGIGTNSPNNRLEIFGNTFNRVSAIVNTDVQNGFQIQRLNTSNSTSWEMYLPQSSTDLRFWNGSDRLTLKSNGYIGIGTITPRYNLEIQGNLLLEKNNLIATDEVLRVNAVGVTDPTANVLYARISGVDQFAIKGNGNIGIGTSSPSNKLEVFSSSFNRVSAIVNTDVQNGFQIQRLNTSNSTSWEMYLPQYSTDLRFWNGGDRLTIQTSGNIGIGTNSPAYKLDVCGTIRAQEVKVDLQGGCDFVFKNDYKLMDLKELEKFVKTNQHLPEIAPEKEMIENGVNLKDLQMKLLQKMEEMTLYIIEQNKKIEILEDKITKLESTSK